ncbi:unnamed protein product [Kuraishia capsulata CBS 1993]|uniref:Ribosome biogenesis protein NOP53 n=1 Tax=Kuraishia capsulata CBS 1993 TaxID=1382522 RepID=W6MHK7_9ASCO|nr:uncharacterized protein KUCA_T00001734001 [Kuraishia capsulata CBS 1993]CDK25764.1 unnamed protein product [Kuraishia capsulata CBS 1993]
MSVARPSQRSQPSRKGKRSWRKNIDIDDVEMGLADNLEDLITHGEKIQDVNAQDLFMVDTEGDENQLKKQRVTKSLKSSEILAKRSKAPGLEVERNKKSNKIQGVSKKEVHRLMKLAGKVDGESQLKTRVAKDGIIKAKAYDVWNEPEIVAPKLRLPKEAVTSVTGWTAPKVTPATLKTAPITIIETEVKPDAGKSYNPSLESWKSLINKEYYKEKTKEEKRIALEEHRAKIELLIKTLDDNELDDDGEDTSIPEEAQEEEEEDFSLSINKPVVNKKKTTAQRNKQKRHEERMRLQDELKSLKRQLHEMNKIKQITKAVKKTEAPSETKAKKQRKLFKHENMESMLEVKLSDELSDSLRKLRPEGNLLRDHMKKLQDTGKVESRVPVKQGRRYKQKLTEKWTYKDFK